MKTRRQPKAVPPEIPKRWRWHRQTLTRLRDGLLPARLKAVPWTRFSEAAEARLECTGAIPRPQPGTLRPVRDEPAAALAESEPTVEQPEPAAPPGAEMSGEK